MMLIGQKGLETSPPGLALLPPRYCSPVLVSALQCIYTTQPSPSNVRQLNQTFPTLLHPSPLFPCRVDRLFPPTQGCPYLRVRSPTTRDQLGALSTLGDGVARPRLLSLQILSFPLLCLLRAVFWRHFRGQLVAGNRYWLCRV